MFTDFNGKSGNTYTHTHKFTYKEWWHCQWCWEFTQLELNMWSFIWCFNSCFQRKSHRVSLLKNSTADRDESWWQVALLRIVLFHEGLPLLVELKTLTVTQRVLQPHHGQVSQAHGKPLVSTFFCQAKDPKDSVMILNWSMSHPSYDPMRIKWTLWKSMNPRGKTILPMVLTLIFTMLSPKNLQKSLRHCNIWLKVPIETVTVTYMPALNVSQFQTGI